MARDVLIEDFEDADLVTHMQAQHPADLDAAVQVAQHMEAEMKSLSSRSTKPVRERCRRPARGRKASGREGRQKYLVDVLQQSDARKGSAVVGSASAIAIAGYSYRTERGQ